MREQIDVVTARKRTAESPARKAEYHSGRKGSAARTVVVTEAKLAERGEEIARYRLRAGCGVLITPVDCVVQAVEVDTKGKVIGPGGTVAEIVPDGVELFAEAQIPASRIGGIVPGFEGALTLLTFDASQFGPLADTVVSVSSSSDIPDSREAV